MTNEQRWKAYQICKERGHLKGPMQLDSNPPWNVCKFCGTAFRYETQVIELDVPQAPAEGAADE